MALETVHLSFTTTFITSLLICHGRLSMAVPRVVILNSPVPYIEVLSGSTVDFTWTFRVFESKMIKAISWRYLPYSSYNMKNDEKLVQKTFNANYSNTVGGSPFLPKDIRNRVNCIFDLLNQIWTMKCRLINAKEYDSAPYGMKVDFNDTQLLPYISNTSYLKVVDIALDTKRSDKLVESWIGRPTVLKCAIQRKVILNTNYRWNVVSEAKDITRGIKRGGNKTSYTFIPLSKKDFGKYKCTISTAKTIVEHKILLKQIHYAGPPEELRVDNTDGSNFVRLFWKQPKKNGGTRVIGYEIIVTGDKHETRKSTTKLSAGVKLSGDRRYIIRVCSLNKVGRLESSCATADEINIAQSAQKGQQNKMKSDSLHVLAALILVVIVM